MALIDWNENGKSPHILRRYAGFGVPYYTIPSNNRELRHMPFSIHTLFYYTIPSNNRELRRAIRKRVSRADYTIPSNNRELRPNVWSGKMLGDYTIPSNNRELRLLGMDSLTFKIIPYQVITGNYDLINKMLSFHNIIPYQVITGNYDNSPLISSI